jgi:hypothetical protein
VRRPFVGLGFVYTKHLRVETGFQILTSLPHYLVKKMIEMKLDSVSLERKN